MSRRALMLLTGCVALFGHASAVAEDSRRPERPNVIIFLVDDLGWRDVGFMGSTFYDTPHTDRLAASGVRFTNAYAASPVCSPTRAALQTGRDPVRVNITDWIPGYKPPEPTRLVQPTIADRLALDEVTIAEMFSAAGYRTMYAGKWHLGPSAAYWPEAQGYDVNKGGVEGGGPTNGAYFSPYGNPRLADGPPGEFLTERLARETIDFIRSGDDRPFFIVHSFFQVHSPLTAAPASIEAYQAKAAALPPAPASVALRDGSRDRARQDNAVYGSMVTAFDTAVGQILRAIDELSLTDDTIVVFTSDNGGWSWITPRGTSATSNLPLRGGKGWLYEGGIRVPLVIRAPGVSRAGATSAVPATTVDLVPTLLELAGVSRRGVYLDGISLASALSGGRDPKARDLHWHYPHYHNFATRPQGAIRSGDYKLIEFFEDGTVELYDLARDPGERTDLASTEPSITQRLKKRLAAWRASIRARLPTNAPPR